MRAGRVLGLEPRVVTVTDAGQVANAPEKPEGIPPPGGCAAKVAAQVTPAVARMAAVIMAPPRVVLAPEAAQAEEAIALLLYVTDAVLKTGRIAAVVTGVRGAGPAVRERRASIDHPGIDRRGAVVVKLAATLGGAVLTREVTRVCCGASPIHSLLNRRGIAERVAGRPEPNTEGATRPEGRASEERRQSKVGPALL